MSVSNGTAGPELGQPLPRRRSPRKRDRKTVVFVAPPGTISRALACAIEAEFPWLRVESVTEPEQIAEGSDHDVQLIAVAHRTCCDNRAVMTDIACKHRQAGFAIMVDPIGHLPFPDLPESLPMRGMLPMNVNLDIWLSILRIMLHGGTYLPPELFMPGVFARSAQPAFEATEAAPRAGDDSPETSEWTAARKEVFSAGSLQPQADNPELSGPMQAGGPQRTKIAGEGFEPRNTAAAASTATHSPLEALTVRECEVLHMVSRGCQNKIIASELDMAENTVKIHLHNIIRKLAVSNRTQAAALYLEELETGRLCVAEKVAHESRRA